MSHFKLTFEILQYWHCGTGSGGEGDVDATPITEPCGLPWIPGKHVKGLLREAARFAFQEGFLQSDVEATWFGARNAEGGQTNDSGRIHVSNAMMVGDFADYARGFHAANGRPCPESSGLFETLRQTSLKDGIARDKTLRSIRCAVPVTLVSEVELEGAGAPEIALLCRLVRSVGHARNDGLGRCKVTCEAVEPSTPGNRLHNTPITKASAVELTLIDDVIVSASSGTAGGHQCLDHIPGSALLGIAAAHCYSSFTKEQAKQAIKTFHAGGVRFGPAYPMVGAGEAVPAPASWHTRKDGDAAAPLCLASNPDAFGAHQPKQIREGFVAGTVRVNPVTGHRLKTAIHPVSGTAEDAKLFGFSYLPAGMRFLARIESDDNEMLARVLAAFDGRQVRIGRSRRNEFGRAKARLVEMEDTRSLPPAATSFSILALSDLALVTPRGDPAVSAEDIPRALGLPEGWKIVPGRTFLRTRRYSPWNAFRWMQSSCFEPERSVIRAGSVIHCEGDSPHAPDATRVGRFQGEGLGSILWELPEAPAHLESSDGMPVPGGHAIQSVPDDPIVLRHARVGFDANALKLAQKWCAEWLGFHASLGPSQWSRLRTAAGRAASIAELIEFLVGPNRDGSNRDEAKKGMFHEGRMAKKWQQEKGLGEKLSDNIIKTLGSGGNGDEALHLAACREAARLVAAAMSTKNKK